MPGSAPMLDFFNKTCYNNVKFALTTHTRRKSIMTIINWPIYQLFPTDIDKHGRLVIEVAKIGRRHDPICKIVMYTDKDSLQNPHMLIYILRWLRWYLPENLPQSEWNGLRIQLICLKNNMMEKLLTEELAGW